GPLSDLVSGCVAENRCRYERDDEQRQAQVAARREKAGGDEQRVAGEKEADEQAGLREDDQRQSELADDADQLGDVVDGVKKVLKEIHEIRANAWSRSSFKSSTSSMPTEIRTRSSVMPICCRLSAGTDACGIVAGWLESVATPPRLSASAIN